MNPKLLPIIALSLTGIPFLYLVDKYQALLDHITLSLIGVAVCSLVVLFAAFALPKPKQRDPWFYFFLLCCFTCVIGLMLGLETVGIVKECAAWWLKSVEEYLNTHWGASINLFDGFYHFALYLIMMDRMFAGKSYRSIGLYWSGSIINSLIVLVGGAFASHHPIRPGILLNTPFFFLPLIFLLQQLKQRDQSTNGSPYSLVTRIGFAAYFAFAALFVTLRALTLSYSTLNIVDFYQRHVELGLQEPTAFVLIETLLYQFYLAPFCAYAAFDLLKNGRRHSFLVDWSLVLAGVVANGQVGLLGPYLGVRAVADPTILPTTVIPEYFWSSQLVFTIGIQLFAWISAAQTNNIKIKSR
uniref:EXPERA domain-containing protein n=1 Tax=Plectus sambesii TaxID=2011161 RepID=A0A914VRZ8_9BILA